MTAPLVVPLPPLPLRTGTPWQPSDDVPRCSAVDLRGGTADRCRHRAVPLHDWHSAGGTDPVDGEPYGLAWREQPALTSGRSS